MGDIYKTTGLTERSMRYYSYLELLKAKFTKIPAVIAHEFHHNIRFSYFEWDHGNVTVEDYLVIEGLADSFAKELYGTKQLGPWVTSMDKDDLEYSTFVIGEALNIKGFAEVRSHIDLS